MEAHHNLMSSWQLLAQGGIMLDENLVFVLVLQTNIWHIKSLYQVLWPWHLTDRSENSDQHYAKKSVNLYLNSYYSYSELFRIIHNVWSSYPIEFKRTLPQ